ncbi:MAG: hypothetical protein KDC24_12630, partial [Saprospiraceae bacterium]|nr:hypothetical protein [Saprospiraceae bacterium]
MKKRIITLCFFLQILSLGTLSAQIGTDAYPGDVLNDFVLVKNEQNLLPFSNLGSLRLGLMEVADTTSTFSQTLQYYVPVQKLTFDSDLSHLNVIVLYLAENEVGEVGKVLPKWITQLPSDLKKVVVFAGRPTGIPSTADAILITPSNNGQNQSLAAQILFGAFGVNGTLTDAASPFPKGAGIAFNAIDRLQFVPPAWVGVDEDSLFQKIDPIVREGLDSMAFPGATILAAKSGKVFLYKTYGYHTYDS